MGQLVFDDATATRIEAAYFAGDAVRRRRIVREALRAAPGDRVADVGCGPGFCCAELAGLRFHFATASMRQLIWRARGVGGQAARGGLGNRPRSISGWRASRVRRLGEVGLGDAHAVVGRPLDQFDLVPVRVGDPAGLRSVHVAGACRRIGRNTLKARSARAASSESNWMTR
jgi:hypothetical protein